jgi:non-heme chloroperoxidase
MDTTSVQEAAPETGSPSLITEREREQIERANGTTATPVMFIHGLWLLPSSWDSWATLFEEAGYVALTPDWPDDPQTVEAARAEPEVLAHKTLKQVADHTGRAARRSQWRSTPASSVVFCHCRSPC